MKRIILSVGLLFVILVFAGAQMSTQKKLIDKKDRIVILDTAAVDTVNAPIVIFKQDVIWIKTDDKVANGGLMIYVNNQVIGRYSSPDIALDAREFNDFDSNDQLRQWLEIAISKNYQFGFSQDGSNNQIDKRYWIVTDYDTAMSYHDTIIYDGSNNVDTTYTKY